MLGCFFLQAEDGIRDDLVTGVQTCALPIQAEDGIRDDLVTGVQTCALPISGGKGGLNLPKASDETRQQARIALGVNTVITPDD